MGSASQLLVDLPRSCLGYQLAASWSSWRRSGSVSTVYHSGSPQVQGESVSFVLSPPDIGPLKQRHSRNRKTGIATSWSLDLDPCRRLPNDEIRSYLIHPAIIYFNGQLIFTFLLLMFQSLSGSHLFQLFRARNSTWTASRSRRTKSIWVVDLFVPDLAARQPRPPFRAQFFFLTLRI